jgi:hypothetical protein
MNTRELIARRSGPSQRMTIPVDADTTRRLERVIALRLDKESGVLVWVDKDEDQDEDET